MNRKLIRPLSKYQINRANDFIEDIKKHNGEFSFGQVMEKLYALDKIFFKNLKEFKTINLSSGISQIKTFIPYLDLIASDLKKHKYYRDYSSPSGSQSLRKTIAIYESLRLRNNSTYNDSNVCLTEGATGAISSIFEYFHKKYPSAEIIIPNPNYYLFKLLAEHYGIAYRETITKNKNGLNNGNFIDVKEIINNITDKTKLIVIVNPNNPTGEIYKREDLVKIIKIAMEKDIYILSDEVFFNLIFYKNKNIIETDSIANKLNALNNVITVKSFSKNRNLPGLRIGYVFSKNEELISRIGKIQEERVFFATASNFKTIILHDCFFQSVSILKSFHPKKPLDTIIKDTYCLYNNVDYIRKLNLKDLKKLYIEFEKYLLNTNAIYNNMFDFTTKAFGKEIVAYADKQSGFNSFIKLKGLENINIFDFCLNLYLASGVKIEAAPYFGFNQEIWQLKLNGGFWMRLTFAQDKKTMKEGIERLVEFKKHYLPKNSKFLKFNLLF